MGRRVLVVDAEDTWTQMLAHRVRHVGMSAEVRRWETVTSAEVASAQWDLVLFGPGPGDPVEEGDPRMARLRELIEARLDADRPLLAVCLSHQVLAALAGLPVVKLPRPNQGVQIPVDLWGDVRRIGFYNTFVAQAPAAGSPAPVLAGRELEVAVHEPDDAVVALRGPGVATIQGHAESVLSRDGLLTLHGLMRHALVGS
jgi:phenazine biosynthesis protein phzE